MKFNDKITKEITFKQVELGNKGLEASWDALEKARSAIYELSLTRVDVQQKAYTSLSSRDLAQFQKKLISMQDTLKQSIISEDKFNSTQELIKLADQAEANLEDDKD